MDNDKKKEKFIFRQIIYPVIYNTKDKSIIQYDNTISKETSLRMTLKRYKEKILTILNESGYNDNKPKKFDENNLKENEILKYIVIYQYGNKFFGELQERKPYKKKIKKEMTKENGKSNN